MNDLHAFFPVPRVLEHTEDDSALVDHYLAATARPWLRASMVMTASGLVTGDDGLSGSVSSPTDRRVFSVIRSLADCVLVASRTAFLERYTRVKLQPRQLANRRARGQSDVAELAIVSTSGAIDVDRLLEAGSSPVSVYTASVRAWPDGMAAKVRDAFGAGAVIEVGADAAGSRVDLASVVADLQSRNLAQIVCEGGPALLASLNERGLVDELAVTISPTLGGPGRAGIVAAHENGREAELIAGIVSESSLMLRYALKN